MTSVLLTTGFLVSALVAAAAVLKMSRWSEFRRELADYELLPAPLVGVVAVALPPVEATSAVAFWVPASRPYGAAALVVLLGAFAVALTLTLRRGRRDVRCACFGRSSRAITWVLPVRNVVLATIPAGVLVAGATDASTDTLASWAAAVLAGVLAWVLFEYAAMTEAPKEA